MAGLDSTAARLEEADPPVDGMANRSRGPTKVSGWRLATDEFDGAGAKSSFGTA